jgi:hypothetical protein|tara:strand:- start:639 stop:791 length:153 start_codon:yes stop_codon:yes gene_type:complete
MLQILLGKWIAKKGGVAVLLMVGNLITKVTKSKKDDELWAKIKPIIKKYK